MKKMISRNTLKMLAILAMALDHIAYLFLTPNSTLYICFRIIGRITFPILAFMIAEGYYHTKDYKKYVLRLFILALISHFVFAFYTGNNLPTSAIFTLLLGLIGIDIYKRKMGIEFKLASFFILNCLSLLGDYGLWGFIMIMLFGTFNNKKLLQIISYIILIVIRFLINYYIIYLGLILVIPLLLLYDTNKKSRFKLKYFFYLFYPIHLIILKLVALLIN